MAFIGMRHVVIAKVSAHTPGTEPTYGNGMVAGKAITGNLTINRNNNPLHADDAIAEDDRGITSMELELGLDEACYHREVGETIARELKDLDEVWLYGSLARHIGEGIGEAAGIRVRYYDDRDLLQEELRAYLRTGDVVLFKGSNSMKLSAVAENILR